MATITVELDDDYAELLTAQHGDLSVWLKKIAETQLNNANRAIARQGMNRLIDKDPKFATAVARLVKEADGKRGEIEGEVSFDTIGAEPLAAKEDSHETERQTAEAP